MSSSIHLKYAIEQLELLSVIVGGKWICFVK